MKQILLFIKSKTTLVLLLLGTVGFAQQGINYQGVARDAEGDLITDTEITLDLNINKTTADGETVYSETHNLSTDANGVFSLVIGQGTPGLNLFEDINWAEGQHFLNVWLDGSEIGTTQFTAVPYTQAIGKWQAHKNGVTPKATGGSIYVGDNAGEMDDFSDNHNIGLGENTLNRNTTGENNIALGHDALKFSSEGSGNIALGSQAMENNATGFNNIAVGNESPLNGNSSGDNNIGLGTAVLYENSSGNNNIALGKEAMFSNTSGSYNIATGHKSLYNNTTGILNVANGYKALFTNTSGHDNIASGHEALYGNTEGSDNIASGYQALFFNATGNNNLAIGKYALYSNTEGDTNIAIGLSAMSSNTIGEFNIAIGKSALASKTDGDGNIAIGNLALEDNQLGGNNIALGRNAGTNNTTGSNNLFLGSFAGWSEQGSNKLYIGSYESEGHIPLIYGEFDDALLTFNAKVGIGTNTPEVPLHVVDGTDASLSNNSGQLLLGELNGDNLILDKNEIQARDNGAASILFLQQNGGDVYVGNAIVHASDKRLKRDIANISYGLKDILKLRPTEYFWKGRTQDHKSLGLIAQEVDEVIENVVTYDEKQDKYGVSYTELIPVLIKALQEQQEVINTLQSNQQNQINTISELKAEVSKMKTSN